MRKKKKKIKKLSPKNTPHLDLKAESTPDYNSHKPIFSFHHMQYRGTHCLSRCDPDSKSSVVNTLLKLSQCRWSEIISTHKGSLGFENIPIYRFNISLPPVVTPEVRLDVFRYSQSGRIVGFRERDIYHLLAVGTNLYSH